MEHDLERRLGENLKRLREARGLSQQQAAALARLPRSTWTNLESGAGNPTLQVLVRVAQALQLPIEELIAEPHGECQHFPKGSLPTRTRGNVTVRKLLPDKIPAMEIDRLELPPGARMTGVPHGSGTREYLTCELGVLKLVTAGRELALEPGDVVAFRGDQPHSYSNPGPRTAVGYSVVALARQSRTGATEPEPAPAHGGARRR